MGATKQCIEIFQLHYSLPSRCAGKDAWFTKFINKDQLIK